jgi:hypothetical protein
MYSEIANITRLPPARLKRKEKKEGLIKEENCIFAVQHLVHMLMMMMLGPDKGAS